MDNRWIDIAYEEYDDNQREELLKRKDDDELMERERKIKNEIRLKKNMRKIKRYQMNNAIYKFINIEIPDDFRKNGYNKIYAVKCKYCDNYKCFPFEFEKQLKNNKYKIEYLKGKPYPVCDMCIEDHMDDNNYYKSRYMDTHLILCSCGAKYINPFKMSNLKWNERRQKHIDSYIHIFYERNKEIFKEMLKVLGVNIYIMNKRELLEYISKNRINIQFKITNKTSAREIIDKMIRLFEKEGKLPVIDENDNLKVDKTFNLKELYKINNEYKLGITQIKNKNKDKLVEIINEKLKELLL